VAFIRQHMMGMAGDPLGMTKRRGAGSGTKAKAARHRAVRLRRLMGDPFISPGAMASMAKAGLASGPKVGGFLSGAGQLLGKLGGAVFGGMGKLDPRSQANIGSMLGNVGQGVAASLQRRGVSPPTFGAMPGLPAGLGFTDPFAGVMGGGGGSGLNKDGSPRRIRADGRPYKRPSLNALNPKALARAGRRFSGFKKAIKSVNASLPGGMKFDAPGKSTSTKRRKR